MFNNQRNLILGLTCLVSLVVLPHAAHARKTRAPKSPDNPRIATLVGEQKEMFEALTPEQKKNLRAGKIEVGYNEWMVLLAKGQPFFKTENKSAGAKKTETVWLFTKKDVSSQKTQEKIKDPRTGWISLHRVTRETSCDIGDFFVIFDRGVVTKITPDQSHKRYGTCEINTRDEMIPIKRHGGHR